MEIEFNEAFLEALEVVRDRSENLFITGRAGTGKSTFLAYLRDHPPKEMAVLAPTGVAALNVRGQTIHSFFGFRPDITLDSVEEVRPKDPDLYRNLELLLIDEVSMVRADLFDCIDRFLQLHGPRKGVPFGGIQVLLIGDLYQLPPVLPRRERPLVEGRYPSPYFFDSQAFRQADFRLVEFHKVYRQKDEVFLEILNAIRNNTVKDEHLELLNSRVIPDFEPGDDDFFVFLTPTNKGADAINRERLSRLPGEIVRYRGFLEGSFDPRALPTSLELSLKEGAQVMLLHNDLYGRWVNGDIGRVVEIEERRGEPDLLWVELRGRDVVQVEPYTWEVFEFHFDPGEGKVKSRTVGTFTQYPLRLAWAITIHKSQGLTFERVCLDLDGGTFSHGQLYVALSRCRSLEGLVLKRPVSRKHILLDRRIVRFLTSWQYEKAQRRFSLEEKMGLLKEALRGKKALEILYLKASDEKTRRVVIPEALRTMTYRGREFLGLEAYCTLRGAKRVFNVSRILEVKVLD